MQLWRKLRHQSAGQYVVILLHYLVAVFDKVTQNLAQFARFKTIDGRIAFAGFGFNPVADNKKFTFQFEKTVDVIQQDNIHIQKQTRTLNIVETR